MADLIPRLEAATEGSRELSDEVLLAFGWTQHKPNEPGDTGWALPGGPKLYATHTHLFTRPDPTRSLDAALTLVPEGWGVWLVGVSRQISNDVFSHAPKPFAEVMNASEQVMRSDKVATSALAFCIAALKAQEQE